MKTMKSLCLLLAMLCCTAVQAQETAAARARVAEIRKAYAEAKKMIAQTTSEGVPRSDTEVTARYVVPGTGPTTEIIHYYYELQNDGEEGVAFYQPYFITRSFNVAARKFYQEFLYDTQRRELIFAFESEENFDGGTDEIRCYRGETANGETGLVHKIVKGNPFADETSLLKKSFDLIGSLNLLLNQDF